MCVASVALLVLFIPGCVSSTQQPSADSSADCMAENTVVEEPPSEVAVWSSSAVVGSDGLYAVLPDPEWVTSSKGGANGESTYHLKLGWFRTEPGRLMVSARLLDDSREAVVHVPDGYGPEGFQPSGLEFSVPGCWEVRGALNATIVSLRVWVASGDQG